MFRTAYSAFNAACWIYTVCFAAVGLIKLGHDIARRTQPQTPSII